MEDYKKNLEVISDALSLPIYLYRNTSLLQAFPSNANRYAPPAFYIKNVLSVSHIFHYIPTSSNSIYGVLKIENTIDEFLIVGPVSQTTYNEEEIKKIYTEYKVSASEKEDCFVFFQNIPHYLINELGKIFKMLHYFVGNRSEQNFENLSTLQSLKKAKENSVRATYLQRSSFETNDTLDYEKIVTEIVVNGHVEKAKALQKNFFNFNTGTLASSPLRNTKNLIISLVTVVSRAAIKGGMESQAAFQMSDLYIRNAESCQNMNELLDLATNSIVSFSQEVARNERSDGKGTGFYPIICYVRKHINYPLTVSHIAAEFGYNSNYLSCAFKKSMGFSLSSFILRAKLEESRELLAFTNKKIVEISEYLCFSNQSHFQNSFRRQFGMTPFEYRKKSLLQSK